MNSNTVCLALAIAALTGCASSTTRVVARAPSAPTIETKPAIVMLAIPEQPEEVAPASSELHVDLSAEVVAMLDTLRSNEVESPHVGGEHVARALPFDCTVPFSIGICAVQPASPIPSDGDVQ
jgi:hypothetical protein